MSRDLGSNRERERPFPFSLFPFSIICWHVLQGPQRTLVSKALVQMTPDAFHQKYRDLVGQGLSSLWLPILDYNGHPISLNDMNILLS